MRRCSRDPKAKQVQNTCEDTNVQCKLDLCRFGFCNGLHKLAEGLAGQEIGIATAISFEMQQPQIVKRWHALCGYGGRQEIEIETVSHGERKSKPRSL